MITKFYSMWEFWHILFFYHARYLDFFILNLLSHQLGGEWVNWMASSSRARSSSPFSHRKPSTPYSSTSSSSSLTNGRIIPRSSSSTTSSFFNPGGRSTTPSRGRSESTNYGSRGYRDRSPVAFGAEELIVDPVDASRSADSISVTIRFRPLR